LQTTISADQVTLKAAAFAKCCIAKVYMRTLSTTENVAEIYLSKTETVAEKALSKIAIFAGKAFSKIANFAEKYFSAT
jgi:hypothetical protein